MKRLQSRTASANGPERKSRIVCKSRTTVLPSPAGRCREQRYEFCPTNVSTSPGIKRPIANYARPDWRDQGRGVIKPSHIVNAGFALIIAAFRAEVASIKKSALIRRANFYAYVA
jgi:hypothetical protein